MEEALSLTQHTEMDLRQNDRGGRPRGLHKTEIETTEFIETLASLEITKSSYVVLVILRNKNRQRTVITKFVITDRGPLRM
jgi:hypothetical protein